LCDLKKENTHLTDLAPAKASYNTCEVGSCPLRVERLEKRLSSLLALQPLNSQLSMFDQLGGVPHIMLAPPLPVAFHTPID
jgi:hypothetical protein